MSQEPFSAPAAGQPLRNLRVLNPRPAGQSAVLSDALRALGADVIALPLLAVDPLPVTETHRDLLLALDRYDGIIVVSGNAARLGLAAVADFWPQWPHALPVFAVGAASAGVMDQAGLIVSHPEQEDSEGLLALPALQHVNGQRWLIWRGEQGRELLAETLRARGAQVDMLPLYRLALPAEANGQWTDLALKPEVVLLSSPAVWHHWRQVAGDEALLPALAVSSTRLAEAVTAAGAREVIVSAGNHPRHWLDALCRWRNTGSHG